MLNSLSIRDIVLIEKLDLSFQGGLTVLTGETGAGKSILLDALALALGARADRALVRTGASQARVIAEFNLKREHPACLFLKAQGFDDPQGQLILRRQVSDDGRSKAWVNDEPVSQGLLLALAAYLVEIHGQHDERGLLDAAGHRALLDQFGDYADLLAGVAEQAASARAAFENLSAIRRKRNEAAKDEAFLRHSVQELAELSPQAGEEESLAEQRADMMQGQKLTSELADLEAQLTADGGVDAAVRGLLRRMERLDGASQDRLAGVMTALDRAAIELSEALSAFEVLQASLDYNPHLLENTEERLFELRRLARKHSIPADGLQRLQKELEARLEAFDQGNELEEKALKTLSDAEDAYQKAADKLTKARQAAAQKLDRGVNGELAPLKLEKAAFKTHIETQRRSSVAQKWHKDAQISDRPDDITEKDWPALGLDRVEFEVKTNPSTPFGPLTRIASGGETARFILALKVVLASRSDVPVLVFDEVDRGIGGATADAVGERLARLSRDAQVLVVTHSPQVAASGHVHLQIEKTDEGQAGAKQTRTAVRALTQPERLEEVARMLAGAEITEEARAAAAQLLKRASLLEKAEAI